MLRKARLEFKDLYHTKPVQIQNVLNSVYTYNKEFFSFQTHTLSAEAHSKKIIFLL